MPDVIRELSLSRLKWSLIGIVFLAMTSASVYSLISPSQEHRLPWLYWLGLVVGGLGLLASSSCLVSGSTRLILDNEGFTIRVFWRTRRYLWSSVSSFRVEQIPTYRWTETRVIFTPTGPVPPAEATPISLGDDWSIGYYKLCELMNDLRARYGSQ